MAASGRERTFVQSGANNSFKPAPRLNVCDGHFGIAIASIATLHYFTIDAESLLVDRPSIRTIFLALSTFSSCKIFFTRVHSPSVK